MRAAAGLLEWFILDACRHGGMTEMELTDGQGARLIRARSKAYEGVRQANDGASIGGDAQATCRTWEQTKNKVFRMPSEKFQNER
jgi:hypothetical protein